MKKLKIISVIGIIFFLSFQNIQSVNADFSDWLFEKISKIIEVRENEKTSIGEFTEKIEKNIEKKSDELEKILESDNALEKISSCDVLNELINKGKDNNYPVPMFRGGFGGEVGIMEDAVMMKSESATSEPVGNSSDLANYSKTNVQVEGVDEGDIIKNDGRYIYILSNSKKSVKIFDTEKSEKIAEIPFSDKNFYGKEIYISGKKLVLIGSGWEEKNKKIEKNSKIIWNSGKNFVKIFVFDLKNLGTQEKFSYERKIFFEGDFAKSRLIGEQLFLITKKYSRNFWWGNGKEKNIGERNIPDFFNGEKFKKTAKCGEIEFFPGSEKTDFVTVSKINLSDKNSKIEKKIFLGDLEKIYMSKKNLYIATGVRGEDGNFWNWDNTQIVKFGLENLELKNIGKVKGRILNQFSMDEFDGIFRIATTKNDSFNIIEDSEFDKSQEIEKVEGGNNLFILDENLKQIGEITGIAKGEQIKSVRFMGNRAFIVTFKNMDPFFVLDLKNPKKPKILGELKIPGWSDYLHPFGENYILGFGKDAKEVGKGENLRWKDIKGMKISLFDITDLKNPKEKFSWKTGERGTNSDILNNHRALFFEKKDEQNAILGFHLNEKNIVEFEQKNCFEFNYSTCPINVCQKRCTSTGPDYVKGDCDGPGSCVYQRRYDGDNIRTTFAGAVLLNISKESGFEEKMKISNFTKEDLEKNRYFYENNERKISRIVRIGDKYYGISEEKIFEIGKNFSEQKNFLIK